jgi:hypothetical protein
VLTAMVATAARRVKSLFKQRIGKRKLMLLSRCLRHLFKRPQVILIDQDILPSHCVQPPSVLQPVYKRLLPHDIVRLVAGKDLIIVIPAIEVVKQITCVGIIHQFYTEKFCRIIEKTCGCINPVDRASLAEEALAKHALPRNDATILQFCVKVVNYPERCHFESEALHS